MISHKLKKSISGISIVAFVATQIFSGFIGLIPNVMAAAGNSICDSGDVTINPPIALTHWRSTQNVTVTFNNDDCQSKVNMELQYNSPSNDGITWNQVNIFDGLAELGTRVGSFNTTATYGGDTVQDSSDYSLRVVAGTDLIGTSGVFTIDNTVPTITSISIPSLTNDTTPTITLNGANDATSGLKDMSFSCDNSTWSSFVPYAGTYSSFDVNTGSGCSVGDGSKTVYTKVRDNALNESTTVNNTFTLDATNPTDSTITFDNSYSSGWTSTGTINFSLTGSTDTNFGNNYAYRLNGTGSFTSISGSVLVPVSTEGTTTIEAKSFDNAGNESNISTGSIKIDTTNPTSTGSITSGTMGSGSFYTTNVEFTISSNDGTDSSGVKETKYCIDTTGACDPVSGSGYSSAIVLNTQGNNYINWITYDNVLNFSTGTSNLIKIDTISPTPEPVIEYDNSYSSGWTSTGIINFSLTGTTDTNFSKYVYRLNGTGSFVDYSSSVAVNTNGTTTIEAKAFDVAGNVSTTSTGSIKIDTINPTSTGSITSGTMGNNSFYTTNVEFTISSNDGSDSSGVKETKYCIDDTGACDPVSGSGYSSAILLSTEGNNYINWITYDNVLNFSTGTSNLIKIDKTNPTPAPTINYSSGYVDNTISSGSVTFSLTGTTDTNFSVYKYRLNGSGSFLTGSSLLVTTEGTTNIEAKGVDLAGNETTISTGTIKLDNTAPTLTFTSISSNNSYSGSAKSGNVITLVFTTNETLISNPTVNFGIGKAMTFSSLSGSTYTYTRTLDGSEIDGSVSVMVSALDLASNNTINNTFASFTTDFTKPTALTQSPLDGTTGVSVSVTPSINFSENLNSTSCTNTGVQLRNYSDTSVIPTSCSVSGSTITLTPTSILVPGTKYYFYTNTSVIDLVGNTLSGAWYDVDKASHEFTVISDTNSPTISSITPTATQNSGSVAPIVFTFSDDIAFNSTLSANISQVTLDGNDITSSVTLSGSATSLIITYTNASLPAGTHNIIAKIKDYSGNETQANAVITVEPSEAYYTKAQVLDLFTQNLANYYTTGAIDSMSGAINDRITTLSGSVYSSGQVNTLLANMLSDIQANYYTTGAINNLFTTNLANYYTTGAIDSMSGAINDRITTLSGSVYSSGQVNTLLANMLSDIQANYYTTGAINNLFTQNLANYYTTGAIDSMSGIINDRITTLSGSVYSSGQVNTLLANMLSDIQANYYTTGAIVNMFNTQLANYYTTGAIDSMSGAINDRITTLSGSVYSSGQVNTLLANMLASLSAPTITYTSIANQFNVSSVPSSIDFTISDNLGVSNVSYKHGASTGTLTLSGGVYNLSLDNSTGLHVYEVTATDADLNKTTKTITYFVVADSVSNVNIQNYTVSNLTNNSVSLSWNTDVTSYSSKVDLYTNGSSILDQTATISGTGNSINISSLQANKTYTVKIKSKVSGQTNYTELTFTIKTATSSTGLIVSKIERINHGDITVGGDYASGYHFRFGVTANDLNETQFLFKLADWSNTVATTAIAGNTKMAVSSNGYDSYALATGSLSDVTNNYGSGVSISAIDSDETTGGRQFFIDVFYKIPTGAAGAYSTSYGIKTQN